MSSYAISQPGLLHIDAGSLCYGGNQTWYRGFWQRLSGCGPTSGSHLLWYLSQTRSACGSLVPYPAHNREGFLRLMEETWRYITPGMRGVNSTAIFADGIERFGRDRSTTLVCRVLEVPPSPAERPSPQELARYLMCSFEQDLPVAFLNLDNGEVYNLDRWHWVTLVGYQPADGTAVMYDQGRRSRIDLGLWLRSAPGGGGFVTAMPAE